MADHTVAYAVEVGNMELVVRKSGDCIVLVHAVAGSTVDLEGLATAGYTVVVHMG